MHLREIMIFFVLFECLIHLNTATLRAKVKLHSLDDESVNNEWVSFKIKNNRIFRSQITERNRLNIFKQNLKIINQQNEKYNNGTSDFSFGVNRFSDMTSEEFLNYVNKGINIRDIFESLANTSNSVQYKSNRAKRDLPESVDWRTQGHVNPIKDQGKCGSCWSFSAVSSLESQYFKMNGALMDFSEQMLVDCVYSSQGYSGIDADGCQGGFMTDAYAYIKQKGIPLSSSYSYTSGNSGVWSGRCKYSTSSAATKIDGHVVISNGVANEALLKEAIANQGSISVGLYVSASFQYYSSGVFTDPACTNNINHAVNLVGYGTTSNNQDYYILRNSWGTSWGDAGYMLFRRNYNNQCSISSYASYPIVKPVNSVTTTTADPTASPTASKSSSTTAQPTTSRQSPQPAKCMNGSGYYVNSGCKTGYYCSIRITNYRCPNGYLFDVNSNTCRLASQVTCSPLSTSCPNGTGYYTYQGCQNLYYCRQTIKNYSCPTGYLFNPTTGNCLLARTYTCPV